MNAMKIKMKVQEPIIAVSLSAALWVKVLRSKIWWIFCFKGPFFLFIIFVIFFGVILRLGFARLKRFC